MRLQDRNMIGGAGVSLQKNGASGILFQFVKDLIKYYKFKYIGHGPWYRVLNMSIFKGVLIETVLVFFAFTFVYCNETFLVQTINTTYCRRVLKNFGKKVIQMKPQ